MKNKPAKYGIKIWWAVDSETWYPLNVQVYLGKPPNETREVNQGQRLVKDVTRKWLNNGRNITADDFFTSIPQVTELLAMKATYIGTIRKNKAEIPREILPAKTRKMYSTLFGQTEKITSLSYVPKKSNAVCALSTTSHYGSITEEEDKKPQ
jgi:hypothetical protein